MSDSNGITYGGFWRRFVANWLDNVLQTIVLILILVGTMFLAPSQADSSNGPALLPLLLSYVFSFLYYVLFWVYKGATPGKMLLGLKVVDKDTYEHITLSQAALRYVGYIISAIFFLLGYITAAFDDRKQGWHDKMAGSVVIRTRD